MATQTFDHPTVIVFTDGSLIVQSPADDLTCSAGDLIGLKHHRLGTGVQIRQIAAIQYPTPMHAQLLLAPPNTQPTPALLHWFSINTDDLFS